MIALISMARVVDQNDDPIEGVKVLVELSGWNQEFGKRKWFFFEKKGLQSDHELILHTDANGRFSVENQRGNRVRTPFEFFEKAGYLFPVVHFKQLTSKFHYGGYFHEDEKHHPDPDQPVLFWMWKRSLNPPSRLIKRKSGYAFKMDGKWYGRDMITEERLSLKDPRADLIFSAQIDQLGDDPSEYDWELTLEMLEGGIQATDDTHLFLAPKDGYEKKIVIKRRSPESYQNNYDYRGGFYLRSYEGRVHASVYIWAEIRRDWGDSGDVIALEYVWLINPFGSRSLEYDPERYEKLEKQRESGELKLSTEEFWKLVDDEDPVRGFDEGELKEIVELLQQGKTPKSKDYQ